MYNDISSWSINTRIEFLNTALIRILAERPESTAIIEGKVAYTYRQLFMTAQVISRQLHASGIHSGHRLALDAPRSSELFHVVVGCLLSGISFIYVPAILEKQQKLQIAADARCTAIFSLTESFEHLDANIVEFGNLWRLPEIHYETKLNSSSGAEVYCVRTSGTTGKPKIVPINVRQLDAFLENSSNVLTIPHYLNWLWIHDLSFDLSIWELLGCLTHGGCLIILDEKNKRDPYAAWNIIEQYRVNVLMLTPSEFRYIFSPYQPMDITRLSLNLVTFCGEKLSTETLRPVYAAMKENCVRLINTYGPSEATVFCSAHIVTETDFRYDSIPIGKPFPGIHFSLENLGKDGSGNLLLKGNQVFDGYDGHSVINKDYLTGDICCSNEEGEYLYIGRSGGFHKINGFRVDLLDIETFLQTIPGVYEAIVWINFTQENIPYICACINAIPGIVLTTRSLRMECVKLSPWLRPTRYLIIHQNDWPMNERGKTDRSALRRLQNEQ
ncbi:AMP-binding protein [Photorhabdus sp. SF281]|uniref:AMP-binding protein n=1 Tax=Photorhabdus sp. SF281 TaxID=3459527 RepID=UPI0040446706